MKTRIAVCVCTLMGAYAMMAQVHHGVAVASFAGPEGPGAAIETSPALPLPMSRAFVMTKSASEQRGSEGLENFRAAFALSYSTQL